MLYITTSWDDGHRLDLKLADLLARYGVRGTFYISKDYISERMSVEEIKKLSLEQEIGAHTLTHPNLKNLPDEEVLKEMRGSKNWLESLLGKEVPLFCYPAGHQDERVVRLAREAGFRGARTTVPGVTALPADPFLFATTLQVYPFPFRKLDSNKYYWGKLLQPFFERQAALRFAGVSLYRMTSWRSVAFAAFEHALAHGEIFHLWGHSWEIERYGMWEDLEWMLKRMSEAKGVRFVSNGELLNLQT